MRLTSIIERLNGSDVNVVYTALAELHTDEEANEFKMPSIHGQGGKLAGWVCAQMDVVGYLNVAKTSKGQVYRKLQFNKSTEVFAKDRFAIFEKPVANLTLEDFTSRLLDGGAEAKEETETDNKEKKSE